MILMRLYCIECYCKISVLN